MISKATDEQWKWINSDALEVLPIFDLVAVSLGYNVDVFRPAFSSGVWVGGLSPQAPEEYRTRIISTYERARSGTLKVTGRTSDLNRSYHPDDPIKEGEWWEIRISDFRRFCDYMEWDVPQEFRPHGYKEKDTVADASGMKPVQRAAAQDAEILAAIHSLLLDPKSIIKGPPGKPGVKAEVRKILESNPLFVGKVFDKAWERLRASKKIQDACT